MTILEKEVLIGINGTNVNYYENLGYNIPRYIDKQGRLSIKKGTKIFVKVEHLSPRTHTQVTKICDNCGKYVPNKKYSNIVISREKGDNKDYCRNCSNIKGWKNYKENLPYEKIFEYYVIANNMEYLLDEFSENNNVKPNEISAANGKEYKWKCKNGHEWISSTNNRFKDTGCPYCSGYYPTETNNLLVKFPDICIEWNYNKNNKSPNEYSPFSNYKVWWKCEKGHEWETSITIRTSAGCGCPICSESKGEKKIREWLDTKFIFESQKEFNGLTGLGGGNLSYDFYLPSQNLLIEYQGEQHLHYKEGFHESINDFYKQQEHDRRKREYAKLNEIELLEIWYFDFENIVKILENKL